MYKYKTKDGTQDGFIPGVGKIVDGFITSNVKIENANLELVDEKEPEQPAAVVGTEAPQPNAVVQAQPVAAPVQPQPQTQTNQETK